MYTYICIYRASQREQVSVTLASDLRHLRNLRDRSYSMPPPRSQQETSGLRVYKVDGDAKTRDSKRLKPVRPNI